jgi:[ribosomal protein S5]-alanine N-acetyltransferase
VPGLERLRAEHASSVLNFELVNRIYFAQFITDRGDEYFSNFTDEYDAQMVEQNAGTCIFHVLVDDDGVVLGRFNLYDLKNRSAVLGYRVAQHVAGRGVATTTVQELCRLAATRYGLLTLRAATSVDNVASQRVLTKAGFLSAGPAEPGGRPGIWYEINLIADG